MNTPDDITSKQVTYNRKVGLYKGNPVTELGLIGGFHIVAGFRGGKKVIFGTGSHPAVARRVAKRLEPEIAWTELSKSDEIPEEAYADLLPRYEALTREMNAMLGVKEGK
jgi:hypothetical protein